jgi:uncharacterized protein
MRSLRLNIPLLAITLGVIGALLAAGIHLTEIDTDITRFLPQNEPVFSDAVHIFKHHPIQSEMVIDLGVATPDQERLLQCSLFVTQRIKQSGLFARVGTESIQAVIPDLMNHVIDHLPVLFTSQELADQVLPLLAPEAIARQLTQLQHQLMGLDAIGQADWIARDPLGIRHVVLAKLAHLAPTTQVQFYKGQLLSKDNQHLLLVATPAGAGTDTEFAGRLDQLMAQLADALAQRFGGENPVTLTPVGAYRAALDNEQIVRRDVQKAIGLSTVGIALLLMLAFPRPVVGLFAFLPAIGGTVAAFFVLALVHRSISIMALGFGGAIISITVDHGIAYLLFLDRSDTSSGKAASQEIWAIGLMAVLTSVGAFGALCFTGFPVFQQLGQFTAMGIAFSFLFVHLVFPKLFPELPPAKPRNLPLRKWVARIPVAKKGAAFGALGFAVVMLFWARPEFNTRLSAMNTVRQETAAAEGLMTRVWGAAIFDKIYLMAEAPTPAALQTVGDALLERTDQDIQSRHLAAGFLPAMVFPGQARQQTNWTAWQAFWTDQRVAATQAALDRAGELGFAAEAFAPFLKMIRAHEVTLLHGVPEKFHALMGMVQRPDGAWMQFVTLTPGPNYDAEGFQARYGGLARIFDPTYFSHKMGQVLFSTFARMLAIVGVSVALLLFFFFLDWKLALITLSPVLFALICTLGTLKLMGHPLDIPALMLAIIVFGMGIDYALFFTRAYQRYGGTDHPGFERIKLAVVMAAASTLIGFGVLCMADHNLLRSAGLTSFLGIGYSLLGAFILLPPTLAHRFRPVTGAIDGSTAWPQRVLARYTTLETYPRLFARFKLKYDVMFDELPRFLNGSGPLHTVLDIGCGFGVPGCWVLDRYGEAAIYGIDPDQERIRVASRAFGRRGHAVCDLAPHIPVAPGPADAAFLLDIIHFLDDRDLSLTLQRLCSAMRTDALLIVRAVIPPQNGNYSRLWRIDAARRKLAGMKAYFRSTDDIVAMLASAGFQTEQRARSGGNQESVWLIAKAMPGL